MAGSFPSPGASAYSGTKAFVTHFAHSLNYELKDQCDVISFAPGLVSTNMIPLPAGSLGGAVVSATESVTACLRDLGHEIITFGCQTHKDFSKSLDP